ncbi:MAG: peptidoglycan DD-metalloendopeptidase family protein [Selenomonadaceae bacterium]|nr:peptidoglycan DD-metalloendopeptidase family protein [Selenomonadaceae bacterium]
MRKIFEMVLAIIILTHGIVFADEIEELEGQKAEYDAAAEEARQVVDAIQAKIDSISEVKRILDEEANLAIADYEYKKSNLEQTLWRIEENQEKLQAIEVEYTERHDKLEKRVRDIYINGQISYLDVMFGAQDFEDFLTRMDLLKRVMIQDSELVNSVLAYRNEIQEIGRQLEQDRLRQAEQTMIAEDAKDVKLSKVAEQQALIDMMENDKDVYNRQYDEMMAASNQVAQMIQESKYRKAAEEARRQQEEEMRRQAEAARQAAQEQQPQGDYETSDDGDYQAYIPATNSGAMIWPLTGPITSEFGWRSHPIFGGQRFHSGIDIGGDYGLPIHAAQSGIVSHAGWIDGYGNTVMIEHGGGIVTLYGHNEGLAVDVGQYVNQGDVIAYCGSTGNSTGPHCHFEVRLNGEPVSPFNYL